MIDEYCDFNNEIIINFLSNFNNDYGLTKIKKIYLFVKNKIEYDIFDNMEKSSETLVMRRGNNRDKTLLLYTLLKSCDFDCTVCCAEVKDNSEIFIRRDKKSFCWFYIKVNYFGRNIELDCSFDKEYLRVTSIKNVEQNDNYFIESYLIGNKKLFDIINKDILKKNDKENEDIYTMLCIN